MTENGIETGIEWREKCSQFDGVYVALFLKGISCISVCIYKNVGCRDAIFTLRTAVDRLLKGGCTANLCSLDLSKAFDKVNHHMLYIKLMERHLPVEILQLLETWLDNCCSCVKLSSSYSSLFTVNFWCETRISSIAAIVCSLYRWCVCML